MREIMKGRILKIKINPKYNLGYCILFLYKDNKYMFHTYEETETDYCPETYTALSKYIIKNNHAELETIDVIETHLFLKDMIKEKNIIKNKVFCQYDFDYFYSKLPNNFKVKINE